ncbi:MAG TPA: hypothetical protein VF932_13110 [Anaerolineae bacterium]
MDQLNVEKKGIPTVTIVTTPFEKPARAAAREQGASDLALAVMEHPIAGHDAAGIQAKAQNEFDKVLTAVSWQPK